MPINSVAGTPPARSGRLARAADMWLTPEQGGLRPEFRGGAHAGVDAALKLISVEAAERVRVHAIRSAASIAQNGCSVPPDGGSPTEAEVEMCDRIADAILQLI